MSPEQLARLDELDAAMSRSRPGWVALTADQRRVILAAFEHATSFTAPQRLRLVRAMRGSEHWPRVRAAARRESPLPA